MIQGIFFQKGEWHLQKVKKHFRLKEVGIMNYGKYIIILNILLNQFCFLSKVCF